jgi:hypothetical protein
LKYVAQKKEFLVLLSYKKEEKMADLIGCNKTQRYKEYRK